MIDETMNSSASSASSLGIAPIGSSWAEEVQLADNSRENFHSRSSLNKNVENLESVNTSEDITGKSTGNKVGPKSGCTENPRNRELSLDFIEGVNELKFERLIKEEKLKTPFKRRHSNASSNESCSVSPNTTNSEEDGGVSSRSRKGEKRLRHNSNTSSSLSLTESDPAILSRRQKQIDYGKNTVAYERYMESVPNRSKRTREHPSTPNKHGIYSRRAFDGLVKIWRKQLHYYDPPTSGQRNRGEVSSDSDSE